MTSRASGCRRSSAPFPCVSALGHGLLALGISQILQVSAFAIELPIDLHHLHDPPQGAWPPLGVRDSGPDPLNDGIRRLEDLVLPDAADSPAESLQSLCLDSISPAILDKLPGPEFLRTARANVVIGTAMPEAAINEDSDPRARKNDIGPSGGRCRVHPVSEPGLPQQPAKRHFRGRVPAPNARHLLRPAKRHCIRIIQAAITSTVVRESRWRIARLRWTSWLSRANLVLFSTIWLRASNGQDRLIRVLAPHDQRYRSSSNRTQCVVAASGPS